MNTILWITCEYVCAEALDNLWIDARGVEKGEVHAQAMQVLSTAYQQGRMGVEFLADKVLRLFTQLSTAITSTTLYLSKLIY